MKDKLDSASKIDEPFWCFYICFSWYSIYNNGVVLRDFEAVISKTAWNNFNSIYIIFIEMWKSFQENSRKMVKADENQKNPDSY